MTEVEKRLISEILSLSLESRVQLVEILTQSREETEMSLWLVFGQ
jgi:hypothetical protein